MEGKQEAARSHTRPGNTEVFFSLNNFCREAEEIFLITWLKNGQTNARDLSLPKLNKENEVDQEKYTLVQNDIDGKACLDVFIDFTDLDRSKQIDPVVNGYSMV